jgi:hypothetical protein
MNSPNEKPRPGGDRAKVTMLRSLIQAERSAGVNRGGGAGDKAVMPCTGCENRRRIVPADFVHSDHKGRSARKRLWPAASHA